MKGYKHLTHDQKEQVLSSYQRTLSATATAHELGLSIHPVRAHLKCCGIALSGTHGGACYRNIEAIRQWANEGLSLSEMARRIGTKHQTVSKFLAQHSIPYQRFRQVGSNNPAWRGGRMIDKHGYILIHMPHHPQASRHGYVREHRLAAEQMLGRPLARTEVVHHIDGDRQHNDPSNLEVFQSNGQHLRLTRCGKAPRLSQEGRERIRESTRQRNMQRRVANRDLSAADDRPS